jgi:uncharacterized protein YggE
MRASLDLDARIAGPRWHVSASNPAWLQAAAQAAVNAREKAAAYAQGVDLRLGRLIRLSESEDGFVNRGHRMAFAAAAGQHDMPVESGEQGVAAAIWATFALQPAP